MWMLDKASKVFIIKGLHKGIAFVREARHNTRNQGGRHPKLLVYRRAQSLSLLRYLSAWFPVEVGTKSYR